MRLQIGFSRPVELVVDGFNSGWSGRCVGRGEEEVVELDADGSSTGACVYIGATPLRAPGVGSKRNQP